MSKMKYNIRQSVRPSWILNPNDLVSDNGSITNTKRKSTLFDHFILPVILV